MRYLLSLPALVVVVAVMAAPCVAQQTLIGYSPASAAREREAEADAIRRPDPARAAAHSRALSQETHVAGTAAQARTRDYVIAQMKAWGLETEVRTYDIWMPHATEVRVWRVAPDTARLNLGEPVLLLTREQLLKAAYYEVLRDQAKVDNYLAERVLDSSGTAVK